MCPSLPWLAICSSEFRPRRTLRSVGGRGKEIREVNKRRPRLNAGLVGLRSREGNSIRGNTVHCLEKVQKFALRICIKDYHETYENLLFFPSLQNRRLFLFLCTFYCIKNKLVYFPCGTVFLPTRVSYR